MTSPIIPERSTDAIDALFHELHADGAATSSAEDQLISDFLAEAAAAFSAVEPAPIGEHARVKTITRPEPLPWVVAAACAALVAGLIAFGSMRSTSESVATAPVIPTADWPLLAPSPVAEAEVAWTTSDAPDGVPVYSTRFGFVQVADGEDGAVISLSRDSRDWTSTTPEAFIDGSAVRAFTADESAIAIVVEFPGLATSPHGLFVLQTSDLQRWTLWPTTSKITPTTESPFASPVEVIDFVINDLGFMFLADVGHPSGQPIVVNAHPDYAPGAAWGPVAIEDLAAADGWFAASAAGPSTLMAGTLSGLWLTPVDDEDAQFAVPPIVLSSGETVLALAADGSSAATSDDVGETWRSVEVPDEFGTAQIDASAGGPAGFVVATRTTPPPGYATDLFERGIQDGVVTAQCRLGYAGPSTEHQCTRTVLYAQPDGAEPIARVEVIPAEIDMTVAQFEQDGYMLQVEFPAEWGGIGNREIGLMPHRLTDPNGAVIHDRPNGGGALVGVARLAPGDEGPQVTFFEPGTDNALVSFDQSEFDAATALDDQRSTIEKAGVVLELTATGGWPDLALFDSAGNEIHRVEQDDVVFGARGIFRTATDDTGALSLVVVGDRGEELVAFDLSADPAVQPAQRTVDDQVERTVWFWSDGNQWERVDINVPEPIRSLVVTNDGVLINGAPPVESLFQ